MFEIDSSGILSQDRTRKSFSFKDSFCKEKQVNIYTITKNNDLHFLRKYAEKINEKFSIKNGSLHTKLPKNKWLHQIAIKRAKIYTEKESKKKYCSIQELHLPAVQDIKAESRDVFQFKKRRKCLTNLAKHQKEIEKAVLMEVIEHEDSDTEYQESELRRFNFKIDKRLRKSCKKVATLMLSAESSLKAEVAQNIRAKELRLELSLIKSDCLRQDENFKNLRVYKEFLDDCTPQEKKGRFSVRYSTVGSEIKCDDDDKEIPEIKHVIDTIQLTSISTQCSQINTFDGLFNMSNQMSNSDFSDEYLANRRESRRMSSSQEQMVYFESPEEFIEVLKSLEERNLFIIENLQSLEEMTEALNFEMGVIRNKSLDECNKLMKKLDNESKLLESLHNDRDTLLKCKGSLDSKASIRDFKEVFYFTEHEKGLSVEKLMDHIQMKVLKLYCSVLKYDQKTKMTTLEMLYRIEKNLDDTHALFKNCSPKTFLEVRKRLSKQIREERRQQKKILLKEAEERKMQKVLLKMNQTVKDRLPLRRVIERSQPPKKKVVKVVIDWDAIRAQEEYDYFFTFKNE